MRLYSKQIPAREAATDFANRIRQHFSPNVLRQKAADDLERSRYSHQEWYRAYEKSTIALNQKMKEPQSLSFFRGAVYVCTFNHPDSLFSQRQMCLLFDLPGQSCLDSWQGIHVLVAPPGLKETVFDRDHEKCHYLNQGFKEVKVNVTPQRTQMLGNNMQGRRRQYGLKHHV